MTALANAIEPSACACDEIDVSGGLLTIDAALATIQNAVTAVEEIESLDLASARGRVLAAAVLAGCQIPRFDNSAMDGYAVSTASLTGQGPWHLPVIARVAAGNPGNVEGLYPGAVQIFTGAPIPAGFDAVVMQEQVQRTRNHIVLRDRPHPGAHIRRAGEDMEKGQIVVPANIRLGPAEIASCAAVGVAKARVRRRLSVAILATGDEIKAAASTLEDAQISDVNTPMLASMMGAEIELVDCSRCADDLDTLIRKLADLETRADLIITTGGVSVGAADFVKPAITKLNGTIQFSGVAMKPGKPISFGRLGQAWWLGLPGNPVSAFTAWTLFGTRLVNCLSGVRTVAPQLRNVGLASGISRKPGRCEVRLAQVTGCDGTGRELVSFPAATRSAQISDLAGADGLIFLPAETDRFAAGDLVSYLPIQHCQGATR